MVGENDHFQLAQCAQVVFIVRLNILRVDCIDLRLLQFKEKIAQTAEIVKMFVAERQHLPVINNTDIVRLPANDTLHNPPVLRLNGAGAFLGPPVRQNQSFPSIACLRKAAKSNVHQKEEISPAGMGRRRIP